MSSTAPVLDHIPLPPVGIPLPEEDKSGSKKTLNLRKRKSNKHGESSDEKEEHSKRKHKKSKKKDKHKDKDKEKSKDKKKGKKHSDEHELTAIEKFNMFKKQREAGKGDDKIVDDLFKDFIASKMKQIESDNTKEKKNKSKGDKDKKVNSMDEMNRFLDDEISNISLPTVTKDIIDKPAIPPEKVKSDTRTKETLDRYKSGVNAKVALPAGKLSVIDNPTKLGSLLKFDKRKNVSINKSNETKETVLGNNIPLRKEKDLPKTSQLISNSAIPLPTEQGPSEEGSISAASDKLVDDSSNKKDNGEKVLPVFGPFLPRSVEIGEKRNGTDEQKAEVKKTIGFKNFGIKLSATSAELIQSGELHKKGKRLEEGEVLSSSSNGSDSSDSEQGAEDDDGVDDNEISGTGSISDSENESKSGSKLKKKKKKKKKLKHKKKKKHKEKEKDRDGVLVVGKEKSGSKRKVSVTPRSRSRSPKKSKRSRSRSRERSRRRSRSRDRGRSQRSRSRSRGRRSRSRSRRSRSRGHRSRSRSRGRRSRSRGRRSRSRSKSPDRFWRSKYGDFDAYKFLKGKKDRSRSKSPDREKDRFIEKEKKRLEDLRLRIDKAKLREIAIKNAVSNARSGGPQLDVAIKSGGKSVEELTEYCKKIQEKETLKKRSKNQYDSSSEEEPSRASDDEDSLHHPFIVKDPGQIVVDIKNSKQLPVVSPQERITQNAQLRITYPVSSGSQHRDKEWVPVEPDPVPQIKPKTNTVGGIPALMPPPPAPPKPKQDVKVFEETPELPVDISSIVSERLDAMKKLQQNPNDVTAKIILTKAQKQASQWAQSKNLPGQFIGSTGASILSQEELMGDKKRQAWLKKDVFTSAAPVTGGIGMFLLQKMGWKHGEGLGKNNEGTKEPLMLDFKVDRRGLVTQGEGKKGNQTKMPVVKDLSGKHPVSALGELCNKRRWGPPHYDVVHESGPAHKKDFLFKVKVNGVDYQPSIASNNKKLAKAQAATVCLQELGLVPRIT